MERFKMERDMGKENIYLRMAKNIMVNFRMIWWKDMENMTLVILSNILDNGIKIKNLVKVKYIKMVF